MATARLVNIEDEDGLLSVDDARPIVEALVNNVLAQPLAIYDSVCPQGCEKAITPWLWYFIASAILNIFLAASGTFGVIYNNRRVKKMLKHVQKGPPNMAKAVKQN
ncbi:hypothetical protein GCK32_009061 [Trichostrongylus colubriformis]|uniref:Uncharacterized protein n=2 Tax=Trichostrongylus colubriformis TaxID=6319 RepID=A0AAN8EMQ7_TRICO